MLPNILEPPALGADPKMLAGCELEPTAADSVDLLVSEKKPLDPPVGAVDELAPGADDVVLKWAKRLPAV